MENQTTQQPVVAEPLTVTESCCLAVSAAALIASLGYFIRSFR